VLHVEVSIALKPTDGEGGAIGGLYDIHDYRAEDFGCFSRPQAVRGALYKAAADLTDEFVRSPCASSSRSPVLPTVSSSLPACAISRNISRRFRRPLLPRRMPMRTREDGRAEIGAPNYLEKIPPRTAFLGF
jgi:hypothetical protein